ncbi:chaperone NapD [Halomonas sp. MCCC 1A17488]|uniref:chaperone NapD n=1 Tax=unclassified Halomonas TaxID=2609666 RepID=UPI0018D24F91|nr:MULTISPECIES: chaperone NapD [unclassified Halomonas]MCE8018378.1 chaperone NapD [Halomonas sp. MCCC 1A17488]MCG3241711.1 chaperone NapD [Halomonas sp. MCCC 1A17488]QPP49262.1 chaperone NapD [Halomonas sp. SS10-MC5]
MNAELHISSLVVQLQPAHIADVRQQCQAHPGVEVHATDPCGKMVLVLETAGQREIVAFIEALQRAPGVLSVSLVYHHAESAEELDREMEEMSDDADAT